MHPKRPSFSLTTGPDIQHNVTYFKNEKYDPESPCKEDGFLKMNISLPHILPQLTKWVTHLRRCDPDLTQNECLHSLVSWERFHTPSGGDMLDTSPGSRENENTAQKKEAKGREPRESNEIENWELMENSTKYKKKEKKN